MVWSSVPWQKSGGLVFQLLPSFHLTTAGAALCCCCTVAQSCLLFATPWNAAHQASLSLTISQSLLKPMSIVSVVPSNHFILCRPLLLPSIFPASGSFPMNQFLASGGQSIGVSASASVLPMNIQDWFPLGWTGWISLQSKGLSRVFSNTTVQKHQVFGAQLFFIVQLYMVIVNLWYVQLYNTWLAFGK